MVTVSRVSLSAFPNSPYGAELQGGFPKLRFGAILETEYVRTHLIHSRTFIRVACVLATLLAVFRSVEHTVGSAWNTVLLIDFGVVISGSIILTAIAWSPAFEHRFLPWARILVPVRNSIVAVHIAQAAAHGQLEMLMVLTIALIGPFFFMGLRFRAALFCGVLTVGTFIAAAFFFELGLSVALRASTFLLMVLIGCAIAARNLERWSRTSFLETRLIAELAQHDALTGTKNRRIFDDHLARLWT